MKNILKAIQNEIDNSEDSRKLASTNEDMGICRYIDGLKFSQNLIQYESQYEELIEAMDAWDKARQLLIEHMGIVEYIKVILPAVSDEQLNTFMEQLKELKHVE